MPPRKKRRSHISKKANNVRISIVHTTFLAVSAIFVVRLFYIQIVQHNKYKTLAQEQHWDLQQLPAKRGDILTSDGFVLAGTRTHYLMYAEPKKIQNSSEMAHNLAAILTELELAKESTLSEDLLAKDAFADTLFASEYKRIYDLLNLDLYWVAIARAITPVEKEQILEKNIEGIGFEEFPVRYYPENTLAAHVLGFVASNTDGANQGYFGIEGRLDGDLKGKSGRVAQEKDALGAPILLGGYKRIDSIDGRDIVLTLDRTIQYLVEKRLKEGVTNYDAASGSVIVMDPMTSEIVAMANFPTYMPNNIIDVAKDAAKELPHRKSTERVNRAISEVYEPGSVIKALTVASAVDMALVTPTTTFVDNGPVKYSDYVIDNWNGQHHGVQTIVQLLQKSNNIGAAWVGHLVGAEKLALYFKKFGLGAKTDVDLEGEDTGIIHDPQTWTDIDLATASFGQGVSVTSLQILNAFNAIANGGELFRPKIVSEIIDEDKTIEIPSRKVGRVISKESSAIMIDMLTSAVSGGESKYFNLADYDIAGKTGTAQIPFEGEYDPNQTNAIFVGFLPKSKKFSMLVRLERPSTSIYASETAVPLWMAIADDLIKYYGIPPDK